MPVVASVDYVNKRIYLSADTVGVPLDTLDVYKEVRALRRSTEDHRRFRPMVIAGGNIAKIPGVTFTQPYVQLLFGCRIVPFDTPHSLRVIRDTFTDDGVVGAGVFDRSTLSSNIDIDYDVQAVEVRLVGAEDNEEILRKLRQLIALSV
jgi:hypothetical protein